MTLTWPPMCHRGDRGDKGDMSNVYASGTPMDATQQAISYIMSCCGSVGAFGGSTDVDRFLKQVASQMAASSPSAVFPGRYIEHVACAVDMVASNDFTSSPAAIASLYLATRFEFYFRSSPLPLTTHLEHCHQLRTRILLSHENLARGLLAEKSFH